MTIKKYTHLILVALCVFSLSCAPAAFAYEDWSSVGVPAGNALMENVYRYEHGDPPQAPSYTPNYKSSSPSGSNSSSITPSEAGGDLWLRYLTGMSKKEFLEDFNRKNGKKAVTKPAQATAKPKPRVKPKPTQQDMSKLPSIKEIQSTLRSALSRDMLKENDWKWVMEDDLDTVKVILRDRADSSQLFFREQTEPWYQDNPYCVGAISGFSQFNENTFVWAPPTMEEHIRAFFKLKCSDAALQRLCEAQFITNYTVLHYKVFCSRLMKIQGQAKGKDATALITAYAKELEAKGPKVFEEREAWRGEPFDVATCKMGIEYMQRRFTELKWDFDPQILKDTNLARFERAETTGQDVTLRRCLALVRVQNSLLKNSGLKYNINKSLQNLTLWLKHAKCDVPSSQYIWKES